MNNIFSMCYQLEDIESVSDNGHANCYDLMVDNEHNFLLANGVVSHNSALGGLMPVLGRENVGYYTLKGKPLNVYSQTQKKFTENKELTGLYQIIKNDIEEVELNSGKYYNIEIDGVSYIANENDEIKIKDGWVKVKSLLNNSLENF